MEQKGIYWVTLLFVYICCLVHSSDAFRSRSPMTLKLWKHQVEVSVRSLSVKVGSEFSVTCDGSVVGSNADPHLRWYGTDKRWIANEGNHERVHVDHSHCRRFLKLHIRQVVTADSGVYTCRGWMGEGHGWDLRRITLVIDDTDAGTRKPDSRPPRPPPPHLTTKRTTASWKLPTYLPPITPQSNVTTQPDTVCPPPKHSCGSGECIEDRSVCDGNPDCTDDSDESQCVSKICSEGTTACPQGRGCLLPEHICDGRAHCPDGWDESVIFCG